MTTIDIKLKTYEQLQFEIMTLITDKYLLQQRIDKAIEYIKAGKTFDNDDTRKAVEYLQNNLLDILKGSDNK